MVGTKFKNALTELPYLAEAKTIKDTILTIKKQTILI